jgi:hypothetical protein
MTLLCMRNVLGRIFSNNKDVIHYVSTIIFVLSITALTKAKIHLHYAVFSGLILTLQLRNKFFTEEKIHLPLKSNPLLKKNINFHKRQY